MTNKKNREKGSKSQMRVTILFCVTIIDFQCTTLRRGDDPLSLKGAKEERMKDRGVRSIIYMQIARGHTIEMGSS